MADEQLVNAINEKRAELLRAKESAAAVQNELNALMTQAEHNSLWAVASADADGFCVDGDFSGSIYDVMQRSTPDALDLNVFDRQETAKGFADVINLIVTVRQCEGAGKHAEDGFSFGYTTNGTTYTDPSARHCTLIPRFPTLELLNAAIEEVGGHSRINLALTFLNEGKFES